MGFIAPNEGAIALTVRAIIRAIFAYYIKIRANVVVVVVAVFVRVLVLVLVVEEEEEIVTFFFGAKDTD